MLMKKEVQIPEFVFRTIKLPTVLIALSGIDEELDTGRLTFNMHPILVLK